MLVAKIARKSAPTPGQRSRPARRQRTAGSGKLALVLGGALALLLPAAGTAPAQDVNIPRIVATQSIDNGAVVLMYHRFGEDSLPSTSVRLSQFEAHLDELTSGGYEVLPLADIVAALDAGRPLPERALAITIDDGALSVYTEAWPRLKARNLPFTVFISTEPLDLGLPGYVSWDQLREMVAGGGVAIGNHGHRHDHMVHLTPEAQRDNIAKAAERITAELGVTPQIFAYPYGEISAELRRAAKEAGFAAAFGQHSGALGHMSDRLTLPRFPINEAYGDMERFRLVANTLPLPATDVTPTDLFLRSAAQNPPNLGFTVEGPVEDLRNLNCFAKYGDPVLTRLDNRIELRLSAPLPAGRARINCTLRAENGRWRWFGTQFVVTEQAGGQTGGQTGEQTGG